MSESLLIHLRVALELIRSGAVVLGICSAAAGAELVGA